MVTFFPPFHGSNMKELATKIVTEPIIDIPTEYSQELNFLVKKLLQKNPLQRPTCDQILNYHMIQDVIQELKVVDDY